MEEKQYIKQINKCFTEKQIEEKKLKDLKNKETKQDETWADKFGQGYKKVPFPVQPKDTVSAVGDPYASVREPPVPGLELTRVQSAPEKEHEQDDR